MAVPPLAVQLGTGTARCGRPGGLVRTFRIWTCRSLAKLIISQGAKRGANGGRRRATSGDVIVIAGKGHETYQIVGADILPFDDRAVARDFLAERRR